MKYGEKKILEKVIKILRNKKVGIFVVKTTENFIPKLAKKEQEK